MGVALVQRRGNGRPDTLWIAEHFMVPEADHAVAFGLYQSRPPRISFGAVLPAVDLDHQACPMTGEIGREHPQRNLEPEMCVRKTFAQKPQHRPLRVGRIAP